MKVKLENLVAKLAANEKLVELVKMMEPSDIIAVVTVDLGLQPQDAENLTNNLLKHVEGMSGLAVDSTVSNKYPVPSNLRKPNDTDISVEEDAGNFINNLGSLVPDMNPDYFPPQPRPDPEEWPYDKATVAYMDPHNKGQKRGMMDAKDNDPPGENPFNANLKKRLQPGGDYGGSQGIYSRDTPHFDNPDSSSGRSYDAKGKPGWSSSPPGKQFDLPEDPDDMPMEKEIEDTMGVSPVGSAIPQFQGGPNNLRRMGFRRR